MKIMANAINGNDDQLHKSYNCILMQLHLNFIFRYAISIGKATDYVGVQEKIKHGHSLIKHVNQAIQLNPQDHTLYFLKGRWCYGVWHFTNL